MKRLLLFLSPILLCATALLAQDGTVVNRASRLMWDNDNPVGTVTSFRVYVKETPSIVPDGTSFVAEVPGDTLEWYITSDIGSHWAVVTAVNDDGTTVIETGPSNEVHYVVIGPPKNLRSVR